ncbi:MAG: CO dehydrogenase/acetyl-CoA synthase complex subunit epsilon [Methanophagales archaeon]|nr:CO dehydrogenase/acetyl-CoA synthase complex subunit epsilon [Methanophagales archaeon]
MDAIKKGTIFTISDLENVRISIGEIVEELEAKEWEPMGPHPMPGIATLRNWDFKLLNRYKPFYAPLCDMCCLCTYGKCDLTCGKKGACGIKIDAQQARIVLIACCIGTAAHAGHARHLVDHLIGKYGRDFPIELGPSIDIEAPIIRTVTGIRPRKLGDLEDALNYVEVELMNCLSAAHTGQEGAFIDFESKNLHVSMVDNLAKEIADIAQIVGYDFPRGDPEAPLVEIGLGVVDRSKPVILCIGHNVMPGAEVVNYLSARGIGGEVEVCGMCCTAIDITRYEPRAKIVGHIAQQLYAVRSGIADVIVVDEQCVRTDIVEEAMKVKTRVIASNDKICYGLPDRTDDPTEEIITDLVNGAPGALILDLEKVGEVAVEVALRMAPKRAQLKALPDRQELKKLAESCVQCDECRRACPNDLQIPDAMVSAAKSNFDPLAKLYESCVGCARCESVCRAELSPLNMIKVAAEYEIKEEKYKLRAGRGPVLDTEIRNVGAPIVFGDIPGVVAYVGCPNYPKGGREVAEMAEEFIKRGYIVVATGCSAMEIARYKDEEGKTLYEKYTGAFERGCMVNIGSCVANAHVIGAAIKIAGIFARRKLRGNFEEIADYILNRVGACGVAWGAMSQKAASIATGCNRWGIPVILGPHGSTAYRRLYLGRKDKEEDWYAYNVKEGGEPFYFGPAPEHLIYAAETKEEAMVMTAKLCIRPSDNPRGRMIKLSNYIDLHERFYGRLPDDWHLFVRDVTELPPGRRKELARELEKIGWKPMKMPPGKIFDPTNLERFRNGWK